MEESSMMAKRKYKMQLEMRRIEIGARVGKP